MGINGGAALSETTKTPQTDNNLQTVLHSSLNSRSNPAIPTLFGGDDKSISSKNHTSPLSEQARASALIDTDLPESAPAVLPPPFPEQPEKPNVSGPKLADNHIANSDKAAIHASDERPQNEDDNFKNVDIRMGERLTDDVIDAYCDKLQESVNKEVDGMLAMQFILLEPQLIKNLVKGDKNVCQVIYDHCRAHYLVLFRNKLNPKRIIVYDPIVPQRNSVRDTLNDSVREQIMAMFGHLYQDDEEFEIAVETGLSTQSDCWSCGLRAVAFVTHLLLGINPANYEYDLEKVGKFITEIIRMDKPSREIIAGARFAQQRKGDTSCLKIVHVTKNGRFLMDIEGASEGASSKIKYSAESVTGSEEKAKILKSNEERIPESMSKSRRCNDTDEDNGDGFKNEENDEI